MRIAIDCFKQVKGVGKSIGIYNEALYTVKNMVDYKDNCDNPAVKESSIVVFGNRFNNDDFCISGVEFIEIEDLDPLDRKDCIMWELFKVSKCCKEYKIDRILYPRGYNAINNKTKEIVLINDLIPFFYDRYFPNAFGRLENFYIMQRLKWAAKSADHIITISEFSKNEIVEKFNVDSKKISIVHCGLNEVPFEKKEIAEPYICAGTSKLPHKNAAGIIKAYIEYNKISNSPLPIIIKGIDSLDGYNVPKEIQKKITCIGFTKDNKEYYSYIANSSVFLYLSLIEGFGYPPIEAMQLGVPVVCSNRASMPETVADAGLLVDPDDAVSVARALEKLITSNEYREKLIARGLENVKRFSWGRIAKHYWNVFLNDSL